MVSLEERLEGVGFTPNEVKVYLALLELGPSSCTPICRQTGLYRVMVYGVLDRLLEKGLVTFFTLNSRRVYQLEAPEKILEAVREKEFQARQAVEALKSFRPVEEKRQVVRLYQGIYGIKAAQENYLFLVLLTRKMLLNCEAAG